MRPTASDILQISDEEFEAMSQDELYELANALGIHIQERLTKEQLKNAIKQVEVKR